MSGKRFHYSHKIAGKLRRHATQKAERALAEAVRARYVQQRRVKAARSRLKADRQQANLTGSEAATMEAHTWRWNGNARQGALAAVWTELTRLGECQQEEARRRALVQRRRRAEEKLTAG